MYIYMIPIWECVKTYESTIFGGNNHPLTSYLMVPRIPGFWHICKYICEDHPLHIWYHSAWSNPSKSHMFGFQPVSVVHIIYVDLIISIPKCLGFPSSLLNVNPGWINPGYKFLGATTKISQNSCLDMSKIDKITMKSATPPHSSN